VLLMVVYIYQWAEAVGEPYSSNTMLIGCSWQSCDPCGSGGRQGICPPGYHVPNDLEWSRYEYCLENTIAPNGSTSLSDFQNNTGWRGTNDNRGPGAKLKAISSNNSTWDVTKASGFTALPAGIRNSGGSFGYLGSSVVFRSATQYSAMKTWHHYLRTDYWQSNREEGGKGYGFSLRCLQN